MAVLSARNSAEIMLPKKNLISPFRGVKLGLDIPSPHGWCIPEWCRHCWLPVLEAAVAGLSAWPKGLLVSRIKLLKETDALSHPLIGKPTFPVGAWGGGGKADMLLRFLNSHYLV